MKRRQLCSALLAAALLLVPAPTVLAEGDTLTVDGVDAMQVSSGDGWSYSAETKTLTLDGYDGGPIIATGELTVLLADGSENSIAAAQGTALGTQEAFGEDLVLTIRGTGETAEGASLTVTGTGTVNKVGWRNADRELHAHGDSHAGSAAGRMCALRRIVAGC